MLVVVLHVYCNIFWANDFTFKSISKVSELFFVVTSLIDKVWLLTSTSKQGSRVCRLAQHDEGVLQLISAPLLHWNRTNLCSSLEIRFILERVKKMKQIFAPRRFLRTIPTNIAYWKLLKFVDTWLPFTKRGLPMGS